MPVKSLERGDYRIAAVIESAREPDMWYRNLIDRATGELKCDCPRWINSGEQRDCKHEDFTSILYGQNGELADHVYLDHVTSHPLIEATKAQWGGEATAGGLSGQWSLEMGRGRIGGNAYLVVLLRLETGNGDLVSCVVAFCERHHPTIESMTAGVSGWAGYAIASECARLSGRANVGRPPEHYRFRPSHSTRRREGPRAEERSDEPSSTSQTEQPTIYLRDILRITDLRDGMTAAQRAEQTLRIFLGDDYSLLERHHFLDIPSRFWRGRIYRLRRDPGKQTEHRVRMFENGVYTKDLCIQRGQTCPEADWYMSVYLRLISDERGLLSILNSDNVWPPYSDDRTRETLPAVWQPQEPLSA